MKQIARIGVVGAGQMGGGIAQVAAGAGIAVRLSDASRELAEKGKARIASALAKLVEKGKLDGAARDVLLGRIEPAGGLTELADCDLVIEAVTESYTVKAAILAEVDGVLSHEALLASNTSSISITKLASITKRPDRFIGMHFMNPVPLMKLVEIIRAIQTSDETYEATKALAERLGKTTVTASDAPGFIVNRVLIPLLNEACFALQEGVGSAADIDLGCKLGLNHPMGPLELADLIGLDTCLYIAEVLHREIGDDKYRPAVVLRNYVAAGWLGRKTKRGFYTY